MNMGFTAPKLRRALVALTVALLPVWVFAQAQTAPPAAEPVPKFDKGYMSSAAAIAAGKEVWDNQCRHCHGNSAYPGKAPKLNPGGYEPDFIFDRVTYGFRKMPPWKDVFTVDQRKAVVAYIKSSSFSP
ncbi:MAG: cytochrome c [Burkholderiaceae bacterium]